MACDLGLPELSALSRSDTWCCRKRKGAAARTAHAKPLGCHSAAAQMGHSATFGYAPRETKKLDLSVPRRSFFLCCSVPAVAREQVSLVSGEKWNAALLIAVASLPC